MVVSNTFITGDYGVVLGPNCDTDNDGIPNGLDLDSDGDGCPDAREAGVSGTLNNGNIVNLATGSTTTTATTSNVPNAIANGPYGANGLANGLETAPESGVTSYPSFYVNYALNPLVNSCIDTDGDGVSDVFDIDDDNDGVLDAVESPSCFFSATEWNTGNKSNYVKISSELNVLNPNTKFSALTDGIGGTVAAVQFATATAQSQLNKELFKMEFLVPTQLDAIYIKKTTATQIFATTAGSLMVQGSNDNLAWSNLLTAPIASPLDATNVTANGSVSLTNSNKFTISSNAAPYKYYRIFGVGTTAANILAGIASEFYFDVNALVNPASSLPKEICTADTDDDDIPNHLDLDSDGDGCSDAIEAGSSTTATSTTEFPTGTDSNGNGLLNVYESTTAGVINYNSTYANYALTAVINACTDTDGDGVSDLLDIDDDNDGVLDAVESPSCFFSAGEWNTASKSNYVKISSELNVLDPNTNFSALTDRKSVV
jgi:hypothetical protein